MCVVIIQGCQRDVLTETGVDWNKLQREDILENMDDDDGIAFLWIIKGKMECFLEDLHAIIKVKRSLPL